MYAAYHEYDFLLSSGMQAPPAEVHVVLEVPSEIKEGMYAHWFHLNIRKLQQLW